MDIKVKNSENQKYYDWFNELKAKADEKTRAVTGYSDNFNKKLQFKMFLKRLQGQSKNIIQNFDSLSPISNMHFIQKEKRENTVKFRSDNL